MIRVLLAALLAAIACASVENVIVAEPGVAFSLPVGKTATVAGSVNRITFTQVREDSRCPTNVVCVWEGDAKIEVSVSRNGAPAETAILSLGPQNNEAQLGDLAVRFVGLAPAPVTPEPAPRRYVAELLIRKL
jgi:hypothetical protein